MTEMNFVNENISPVDELQQIITDNVEWLRRRRKITQTDLAVDMHISQPNLSKKIRGSIAWTLPDIALLADYFGVPVVVFGDGQHRRARLSGSIMMSSPIMRNIRFGTTPTLIAFVPN